MYTDMYTDMPTVDRGTTATSRIRAQNAIRFLLGSSVRSALIRSHSPTLFIHFSRPLVYVLEDAVHGLCSCSSFSGSCFRPFRRYVSFRNFCVGGQSIHVTFSTRAADMYTDMPIVDRGATATSGIRAQNTIL